MRASPPAPGKPGSRPRASHPWIAAYCTRLLALMPSMRVEAALQRAIYAFPYCADLDPADAADRYVIATHAGRRSPDAQAPSYRINSQHG